MNAMPRNGVEVVSFGCRLNLVESEAMRQAALDAGRDRTIIVNTCAVTAESVRQARQSIRRLAREKPGAQIVVSGCAAETERAAFAGNAIALRDDTVWMSATANAALAPETRASLRGASFTVRAVALDAIEAGGGSLRCCVGEIF